MVGARLDGEAKVGADEGGAKLGDQFLGRVGFRPEPPGEVAPDPVRGRRGVTRFVQGGGVVGDRIGEQLERRKLDEIA